MRFDFVAFGWFHYLVCFIPNSCGARAFIIPVTALLAGFLLFTFCGQSSNPYLTGCGENSVG